MEQQTLFNEHNQFGFWSKDAKTAMIIHGYLCLKHPSIKFHLYNSSSSGTYGIDFDGISIGADCKNKETYDVVLAEANALIFAMENLDKA